MAIHAHAEGFYARVGPYIKFIFWWEMHRRFADSMSFGRLLSFQRELLLASMFVETGEDIGSSLDGTRMRL